MTKDSNYGSGVGEEIEGAPPALSGAELSLSRRSETKVVNRYLFNQTRQIELMLLEAADLLAFFEVLLVSLPRHFAFRSSELWLFDPDDLLSPLMDGAERYGQSLQLLNDVFPMQELYELEPDIVQIDTTDSRMFEVLKSEHGIDGALLMPLMHEGEIIGSLHVGYQEGALSFGEAEDELLAHLTTIVSLCLRRALTRRESLQLTLLDSLTHISNARGFSRELSREISRALRTDSPVTVLLLEIDEFSELYQSYGERRGQFVIKKIAERLLSNMRLTDCLARLEQGRFTILLPATGEAVSRDIAERLRRDIEQFSIDDGRGAVLQVCISAGFITWEPQQFPAVDLEQLARQMGSVANKALQDAIARGGNCVAQSRLSTLVI